MVAFPSVRDNATSENNDPSGGNHIINYPTTVVAGDTLIMWWAGDDFSRVYTVPADWTEILDVTNTDDIRYRIHWKKADGTEGGGTFTITTDPSGTDRTVAIVASISGAADPNDNPPEVDSATGSDSSPDPPSSSPSGGKQNYLWFGGHGIELARGTTAYPSNMTTGPEVEERGGFTNNQTVAIDFEEESNSTFNPDSFTVHASGVWVAATGVIYPPLTPPFQSIRDDNTGIREFSNISIREHPSI